MDYSFLANWNDFLPREEGHLLGLVGAGDRETVLNSLASFYRGLGLAVNFAQAGNQVPEQVITSASLEQSLGSVTICEVEENVSHPLKLPLTQGNHWPMGTTLALVVLGSEGVGTQACAALHGLGHPNVGPVGLAEMAPFELVTWEHVAELLCGENGYLQHVPQDIPVVLAITGLEEISDSIGLFGFLGKVMQHPRLPLVLFCSRGDEGPSLRTAYRLGGEGAVG